MTPGHLLELKQRRQLEAFTAGEFPEPERRHAQILILYDDGLPTREIAATVGLSKGRVRYWRRQCQLHGLTIFRSIPKEKPFENLSSAVPQSDREMGLPGQSPESSSSISFPHPDVFKSHLLGGDGHPEYVRELALSLFDRTQGIHHLGDSRRRVLKEAALLLEFEPPVKGKRSIQTIRNWIRTQTLEEFSPEEQTALAAVITFQAGKIRQQTISRLELSPAWQQDVLALTALLRIASGLDHSRRGQTRIRQVEPGPGGLWLVVEGSKAVRDAEAAGMDTSDLVATKEVTSDVAVAQHNAQLWEKIGFPHIRVFDVSAAERERSKYPALPEPFQSPGVLPGDSMAEAGRKVMLYHFAEMLSHEEATMLGENIEALHDMRVATRRMRAAFEVFSEAFEPAILKPHLKGLRMTGRALGQVRDLDVFMEKAQHYLDAQPEADRSGLDPLLLAWGEQRENARAEMLAHLGGDIYRIFKQEFNLFLQTPGAGARPISQDQPVPTLVRDVAPALIYTRLASVRAFDKILQTARIEQLHALRIEFKKLRYTVEFFREVLGEQAKAVIDDLKKLQDHLGDLNDAEVATGILREFLDNWDARQSERLLDERQNPEAIFAYLTARHAERYRLIVTFGELWAYFNREEFRRNLAMAVSVL
jgi:CHAD domain-containing protein